MTDETKTLVERTCARCLQVEGSAAEKCPARTGRNHWTTNHEWIRKDNVKALGEGIVQGRPYVSMPERRAFHSAMALCLSHTVACECNGCLDIMTALKAFVTPTPSETDREEPK